MNKRELIVVLGVHRGGTSALARALQVFGVDLGANLMPAVHRVNEKGFFEDNDIVNFNIELMQHLSQEWHTLTPIPRERLKSTELVGFKLRAISLLQEKMHPAKIFGMKDPRFAKLLPFWRDVFDDLGLSVKYLISLRNPLSVASSLKDRDKFGEEKSHYLWLMHLVPSILETDGKNRILVDYDNLMDQPKLELTRIAKVLELEAGFDLDELSRYETQFLEAGLRHTNFALHELKICPSLPPFMSKLYLMLIRVASDKLSLDDEEVRQSIQSAVMHINEIAPAFYYMTRQDKQIADLDQALAEREKQIADLDQALAERDKQIADLNQALAERDKKIGSLDQAVEEGKQVLAAAIAETESITMSNSWCITAPLRAIVRQIKRGQRVLKRAPVLIRAAGGPIYAIRKTIRVARSEGLGGIKYRLRRIDHQETNLVASPQDNHLSRDSDSPDLRLGVVPYYLNPNHRVGSQHTQLPSIAIHLHLFYEELSDDLMSYLDNVPYQFDLYISIQKSANPDDVGRRFQSKLPQAKRVVVERVPNRGRDIAPLIIQFGSRLLDYDIIGHFHTQKSPHSKELSSWFKEIFDLLFGPSLSSGGEITQIIDLLSADAKVIYPQGNLNIVMDKSGWADNYFLAQEVLETHTTLRIEDFPVVEFSQGAMFWAKATCLQEFLSLPLSYRDFPAEPIPPDGTLAHALERLILVFASSHEGRNYRLCARDSLEHYAHYEEQQDFSSQGSHPSMKVLSYYLPQFHPIPENDAWHGAGFTEWTKVRAANPLFYGHYQQHIPHKDIGYYLLDTSETLQTQAEMMRKAGVSGQIFYHYWFTGKLILEKTAQMLLDHPDIEMPFCFCWANENWTRKWDGNEQEVLLKQSYSAQDALDFIKYLIPFFKDARYIKAENRPVLFIYRPSSIPDTKLYLDVWAAECRKHALPSPYVVAVLTRGARNPGDFGMDGGVERVLHDWTDGAVPEIKSQLRPYHAIKGSVLNYGEVADFYMGQTESKPFTYFRSVVPMWDNSPRYGSEAYLLHGSTPPKFQQWLEAMIRYTERTLPKDCQFLVINAWNEWAESAHLEPDTQHGYAYLNSVGRALSDISYISAHLRKAPVPEGVKVSLRVPSYILEQFAQDSRMKRKVLGCLAKSTIFNTCRVRIEPPELADAFPTTTRFDRECSNGCEYIVEIRRSCVFSPTAIEDMLRVASTHRSSVVIANGYGDGNEILPVHKNGSIERYQAHDSPLVLLPTATQGVYKNFRLCPDAQCYFVPRTLVENKKLPVVTTIIRFHKGADMHRLSNALLSLLAMRTCIVQPMIAAQDLSEEQKQALEHLVNGYPWDEAFLPIIIYYQSSDGKGDLRARMLTESLKSITSKYAAFLDYDDVLFPDAYKYLIDRLVSTGKAVTFGRVYVAHYDPALKRIIARTKEYEYGFTYDEFLSVNHSPIHSFMLDIDQIDRDSLLFFEDQKYMEDYFLTLQIFSEQNTDWESLAQPRYIGDYIHNTGGGQTLAILSRQEKDMVSSSRDYMRCDRRIYNLKQSLLKKHRAYGRAS